MRVETTPFVGRPPAVGLRCWSVWRCLDSPRPTRLSADRRRSQARQRARIPIRPHRRFGTPSPRRLHPRRLLLCRRRPAASALPGAREGAEAKSRGQQQHRQAQRQYPKRAPAPKGTLVLQPERPGRSRDPAPARAGRRESEPSRRRLRSVLPRAHDRRLGARGLARSRASAGLTATLLGVAGGQRELLFFAALWLTPRRVRPLVYVLAAG